MSRASESYDSGRDNMTKNAYLQLSHSVADNLWAKLSERVIISTGENHRTLPSTHLFYLYYVSKRRRGRERERNHSLAIFLYLFQKQDDDDFLLTLLPLLYFKERKFFAALRDHETSTLQLYHRHRRDGKTTELPHCKRPIPCVYTYIYLLCELSLLGFYCQGG